MSEFFSIRRAAEMAGVTTETLRHYDRIGLVKPCKTDEWTGYRYYSQNEIVRLNTIKMLRCMDMPLTEIREILAYDDFGKIVAALARAEKSADAKIAELTYAKTKIGRARAYYESKIGGERPQEGVFVKSYPKRVILLSDTMQTPTKDNLWAYHRHFYEQIPADLQSEFSFEDAAGIYERSGQSRLFAICTRYVPIEGIEVLPQGKYLCADCTEENRDKIVEKLYAAAKNEYNTMPECTVQLVVLSGILQWTYRVQMYISA